MSLHAARFNSEGVAIRLCGGSARQLNVNLKPGETWRPIPRDVRDLGDVPNIALLPAHPDLVEPD